MLCPETPVPLPSAPAQPTVSSLVSAPPPSPPPPQASLLLSWAQIQRTPGESSSAFELCVLGSCLKYITINRHSDNTPLFWGFLNAWFTESRPSLLELLLSCFYHCVSHGDSGTSSVLSLCLQIVVSPVGSVSLPHWTQLYSTHFQVKVHGQVNSSSFALKCREITGLYLEFGRQEAMSPPPDVVTGWPWAWRVLRVSSLCGKLTSTLASFKKMDDGETCLER